MAAVVRSVTMRSDLARRIEAHAAGKVSDVLAEVAVDAERTANEIFARDYQSRSGEGAGSIRAKVVGNDFPVQLVIGSNVDHVDILNAGARPHVITANKANNAKGLLQFQATSFAPNIRLTKAAASTTPRGTGKRFRRSSADFSRPGKIVRTDHVNHPGVKPGRFFERAVRQALENAFR